MQIAPTRLVQLTLISIVLGASAVLAALHLLSVLRFGVVPASSSLPVVHNDFISLYAGARLAASGRPEQAYDIEILHSLEKEIAGASDFPMLPAAYPPFFNLALMPFAALDKVGAYRLWVALTFLASMLVAVRISPHWHTVLLVPLFPAVAFCAAAGQNGNLSAALVGAGLLLLPHRPAAAGVAFGLMAFKPQLALAIPFCLLGGGHYRTIAVTAVTAAATVLASLIAFGPAPILGFLPNIATQAQLFFGGRSLEVWERMPTVMVKVLQLTHSRPLAVTIHVLIAAGALAALARVWRNSTKPDLRALALAAAMPLATPYYFDYDLALMVIPFAFLIREMRSSGLAWQRALVLAALWLTQPAVTLLPAFAHSPLAPVVWIALLAYASRASSRANRIRLQAGTDDVAMRPPRKSSA